MIAVVVQDAAELYTVPPTWLPERPTLDHYRHVLVRLECAALLPQQPDHLRRIDAGRLVAGDLCGLWLCPLSLPRPPLPALAFVLVGQLLPTAAIIVPLFVTLRYLGLVNTYWD